MYNCYILPLTLSDSSNVFPKNDENKEYIYFIRSLLLITLRTSQHHIYLIYDSFLKYSRCDVNHQSIDYSNHTKLYISSIQMYRNEGL